ncbi:hypothetical protein IAU60_001570 [Kwoniella sp. DSM 27419]
MSVPPPTLFPSVLDAILHFYPLSPASTPTSPPPLTRPSSGTPLPPPAASTGLLPGSSLLLHPAGSRLPPTPSQTIPVIEAPADELAVAHRRESSHDSKQGQDPYHLSPTRRTDARGNKENTMPEDSSFGRSIPRGAASPSRPPKLSALSPLQTLSPMQPPKTALPSSYSETGSVGGRSRSSSVTKSLSRRQSVIAHAASWAAAPEGDAEHPYAGSSFSRLTLVKAPAEDSSQGVRRHSRSKSSSALAPFTSFAAASDAPATSNRGPRRSFAASSFGGFSPMTAARSPIPEPGSLHRVHSLHGERDERGIQRKLFSPDEVVDIARGLSSPVMMPEGGFKGAELKRRKSAGASSFGSRSGPTEQPPVALEPVEYVQMEEDVLLPFVERPAEVTDLASHPANEKMFKLIKAAFPKDPARPNWREISPEQWNWEELMKHLTKIDRPESPDYDWIFRARQAVRARSVALWEKLGICLGCDGDLLNAGSEDDIPASWGGLGLGDEGEYDPSMNQVWIEGLEPVDADEGARAEKALLAAFGDVVEDEGEQAAAGMTALMGDMDAVRTMGSGLTTAQRAGNQHKYDPLTSPSVQYRSLGGNRSSISTSVSPPRASQGAKSRSKSFVGLQICTSPSAAHSQYAPRSPSSQLQTPVLGTSTLPVYERGPGSPLFPSSFSSLSAEPNLGRSASVAIAGGGRPPPPVQEGFERFTRRGLARKPSGAGLSESAITFASESDYAHSHGD